MDVSKDLEHQDGKGRALSCGARLRVGEKIARRTLYGVSGERVEIGSGVEMVHLQFRRYAGCPICKLHLHTIAQRHREIRAAGVVEAAVFHSERLALIGHADTLPFPVISDPTLQLYEEFGVERGLASVLDPRAWRAAFAGIARFGPGAPARGERALGLPGDFLIRADGVLLAAKYGKHADDHWSVDDIVSLANAAQELNGVE